MKWFNFILFSGLIISFNAQVNFTDSNLPIVVITAPVGQQINDVNRIVCDMGVIDNGPGVRNYLVNPYNNYNGKIAIEVRGSTSQQYPKKSYGFETQDALGMNNNVPLLGLPIENDWILYGPYPDKTLIRDVMTFDIFQKMGHYASNWRYCELVINGQYQGLYILLERIKRDNNRVDVAKLDADDLAGDSLTGGYIVKVDKLTGEVGYSWTSNYNTEVVFQFHDPEFDQLNPIQASYMENFIGSFEDAVWDLNSMIPCLAIKLISIRNLFMISSCSRNWEERWMDTAQVRLCTNIKMEVHGTVNCTPDPSGILICPMEMPIIAMHSSPQDGNTILTRSVILPLRFPFGGKNYWKHPDTEMV